MRMKIANWAKPGGMLGWQDGDKDNLKVKKIERILHPLPTLYIFIMDDLQNSRDSRNLYHELYHAELCTTNI